MKVYRLDYGRLDAPIKTSQGFIKTPAYVTRTGVFQYMMVDGSIKRELRHPDEVFNPKSIASLSEVPITNDHPPVFLNSKNAKDFMVGFTGKDVIKDGEFIKCDTTVTDYEAVKDIEYYQKRETSCGYECELDETPGVWNGEVYDSIQRSIFYNHVAIVDQGRAGPQVRLLMDGKDVHVGMQVRQDAGKIDGWEETENEIRHRVKEPSLFDPESFRTKELTGGISIIIGKLKNPPAGKEGSMVVQSYRFKKGEGWTMAKAKEWVTQHKGDEYNDGQNKGGNMPKITLAGKEYEVSEELAGAVKVFETAHNDTKTKLESSEKNAESLKGKVDALEADAKVKAAEIDKIKAEKPSRMDTLKTARARIELETFAKSVLGTEADKMDFDKVEDVDIQKAVIQKVSPDIKMDGKTPEYVNAYFDIIKAGATDKGKNVADALKNLAKDNSNVDGMDLVAARQKAQEKALNAWRQPVVKQ